MGGESKTERQMDREMAKLYIDLKGTVSTVTGQGCLLQLLPSHFLPLTMLTKIIMRVRKGESMGHCLSVVYFKSLSFQITPSMVKCCSNGWKQIQVLWRQQLTQS